jgi:hypothetical protein
VAGDGGEDEAGAKFACGFRGGDFAPWMDHSAVADRGEHGWEGKVLAEHPSLQITASHVYCLAGAKYYVFKYSRIFAEGDFVFGAAIDVVKDQFRKAATREVSEVGNIDDMRRRQIWQTHRSLAGLRLKQYTPKRRFLDEQELAVGQNGKEFWGVLRLCNKSRKDFIV